MNDSGKNPRTSGRGVVNIWRLFDFAFERNRPRGMINAPLWYN